MRYSSRWRRFYACRFSGGCNRGTGVNVDRVIHQDDLFTEGNHFCPSCEASGDCTLQAVAYELGMMDAHYTPLFPDRPLDASHPDVLLDFNRCILCELCVRASALVDKKRVFALSGRGITKHLVVSSESGLLADTNLSVGDKAMSVCPVGVILRKRRGFATPIGSRKFDAHPIREVAVAEAAARAERGTREDDR